MSQYDDYMRDYRAVIAGTKPAMIVERRKSPKAWLLIGTQARGNGRPMENVRLRDSAGGYDHAIIVAGEGARVNQIMRLIDSRTAYSRADFQRTMGMFLGYATEACETYVKSREALTCGCELCGGPTWESRLDDEAHTRRTYPYA